MNKDKIIQYIKGTSSTTLSGEVEDWINSSAENAKKFYFLKAKYIGSTFEETSKTTDIEKGLVQYKKNVGQSIQSKRKNVRTLLLKYAAILVVIFGLGSVFYLGVFNSGTQVISVDNVVKLELENGNTQVIMEEGAIVVLDSEGEEIGSQQGQSLVYKPKISKEILEYNTLKVPYGKRFDLVLSDNTQVILNAGSSLKYPVQFIKGKSREVYLSGEAFFKVAKDTIHPFVVNTKGLDINVLGTVFNVSAYREDSSMNVVLTEGSVKVRLKGMQGALDKPTLLTPGHMAVWEKSQKDITTDPVDVSDHIAWVNGKIVFKDKPFLKILKILERHYNVSIKNNYNFLNDQKFLAKFDSETIEEVLRSFQKSEDFLFVIDGNKIEINKPLKAKPVK